jgi:hypothetical protein
MSDWKRTADRNVCPHEKTKEPGYEKQLAQIQQEYYRSGCQDFKQFPKKIQNIQIFTYPFIYLV